MKPYIFIAYFFCFSICHAQFELPSTNLIRTEKRTPNFTGTVVSDYSNGNPKLRRQEKNGKADGLWLEWYPNGNLRYRAMWRNGLGNGKWEYFYSNGQLRSESFYIDDVAQGLYRSYHENGQLAETSTYLNGKLDGIVYNYGTDGMILSRKRFVSNQRVIDEPILFQPGIIATKNNNEWGITFSQDGNMAYFTRRTLKDNVQKIYESKRQDNGEWSTPTISEFSIDRDESPFISPDGKYFLFASCRSISGQEKQDSLDMNLWMMTKTKTGWSHAKALPDNINKLKKTNDPWPKNYETGASIDLEGNIYYWTMSTNNQVSNLYKTKLGNLEPPTELIPPSHEQGFDSGPLISPDGNLLIFVSSNRTESFGSEDLYYSKFDNGIWTEPKNMGSIINSQYNEAAPRFSPDGKYFFFTSDRGEDYDDLGERIWSIYHMETQFLFLD